MVKFEGIRSAGRGPLLMVHGGAWDIPDEECEAHRAGLLKAIETGRNALLAGKKAVDVVVEVAACMESDGAFDAGRGAVLNRDGFVELDAGIMDGETLQFGAVAGIQHFENPVQIAREIIKRSGRKYCFLSGSGAENFARTAGFEEISNDVLICEREKARFEAIRQKTLYHASYPFLPDKDTHPRGTVGCVAIDLAGRIAAATSTGGTPFRIAGRIGDSPLPGCGYYAGRAGAASATGWGEAIASVSMCYEAVRLLDDMNPEGAAERVIRMMHDDIKNEEGEGATGGIILLSRNGKGAFAFSTPRMARGIWDGVGTAECKV